MNNHIHLEDQIRSLITQWEEATRDDLISASTHDVINGLRDLLTPDLPDPLFLAKATHPYFGEGIVISHFPDDDGTVRLFFRSDKSADGTSYRWVYLSTLTFHTQETPEFLETEEDYRNAPEGTIVAMSAEAWTKTTENEWSDPTGRVDDKYMSSGVRRRVLRWKWEA